jgi:2-methylisocitrate lyase-like PEP mutase family enzyme
MRQVDRQQAEDARQQAEKARAQAIAAQENLYLLQQAEQAQAQAKAKAEAGDDAGAPLAAPPLVQARQTGQATPAQPPAPAPHWSFRNMSTLDKAGLAALGVLLVVLAYAAGIIPAKLIPSSRSSR